MVQVLNVHVFGESQTTGVPTGASLTVFCIAMIQSDGS